MLPENILFGEHLYGDNKHKNEEKIFYVGY